MTIYYVLGIITAVWAVGLAAVGLTRDGFPPSGAGVGVIIAVTGVLVVATVAAVITTTHPEHPRADATAAVLEGEKGPQAQAVAEAPEEKPPAGGGTSSSEPSQGAGQPIEAVEKEFTIKLAGGKSIDAGEHTFKVVNDGQTPHDLAIEGNGIDEKTALIDPGKSADLTVDLKPGTYKVYCTVPGHADAGMKFNLEVK